MFHRVPGASKVAICRLVEMMRKGGFLLLDTQWVTPHLEKFGAREIARANYLVMLNDAVKKNALLSC
jgi:leucyl/phenylalanyl-tRNA--protein transferase